VILFHLAANFLLFGRVLFFFRMQLYFLHEMLAGLRDTNSSTIKMLPSYVTKKETKTISGNFYALDLGSWHARNF